MKARTMVRGFALKMPRLGPDTHRKLRVTRWGRAKVRAYSESISALASCAAICAGDFIDLVSPSESGRPSFSLM